ncbi:hypothetical protein LXL04_022175 [Taraxacum kok-saghyz]
MNRHIKTVAKFHETMGTREKQVQLKVYYDQKKKKVMFAEAEEDFVDILLSFFVLPLGTITKFSRKHADLNDIKLGSLTSLYESVVNLNENYFSQFRHKDLLVNPKNWLPINWPEPKVSLDKKMPQKEGIHIPVYGIDPLFVKNKSNFIITEDLNVLPVKLDTSIVLPKSLGIENINLLEERTMSFGFEEFLNLLIWSLLTNNPLTNLVFGGIKQSKSCINNSNLNHLAFISSNSGQTDQTVKLVIQKSKKKLLCAQVEKFFVELLFSFLTIPLGAFLKFDTN